MCVQNTINRNGEPGKIKGSTYSHPYPLTLTSTPTPSLSPSNPHPHPHIHTHTLTLTLKSTPSPSPIHTSYPHPHIHTFISTPNYSQPYTTTPSQNHLHNLEGGGGGGGGHQPNSALCMHNWCQPTTHPFPPIDAPYPFTHTIAITVKLSDIRGGKIQDPLCTKHKFVFHITTIP